MAYLQGFVQKLAETYAVMQADVGRNHQIPVQNLYKNCGPLRVLRPFDELARRKGVR